MAHSDMINAHVFSANHKKELQKEDVYKRQILYNKIYNKPPLQIRNFVQTAPK